MTAGSISAAEYHRMQADAMSEVQFQAVVIAAARRDGWRVYHTHDSRGSQPGFPDLVLLRGRRTLFRELKTSTGRLRPEQSKWFAELELAGNDTAVWRPIDWFNGSIPRDLAETHP